MADSRYLVVRRELDPINPLIPAEESTLVWQQAPYSYSIWRTQDLEVQPGGDIVSVHEYFVGAVGEVISHLRLK